MLAVALAAAAVSGAGRQNAVFRTGTLYVQLDAVVTGSDGRPVKGLTKDDFLVSEGGQPQTIVDFKAIDIPAPRQAAGNVTAETPSVDVVSNTHAPAARQWVLLIDDLHIIELHTVQTKRLVQAFLQSLSPGDSVAVVFVGRSDLSVDFTQDIGRAAGAVGRIAGALGFAPDAADDVDPTTRYRYALATLHALDNISASLVHSTFPRRALVYVSEGMTYGLDQQFYSGYLDMSHEVEDVRDVASRLGDTLDAMRRAGVPVYTIDPRGIPDCTAVRGPCRQPPLANIRNQQAQLRTIAAETGGRALVSQPDVVAAVRQIVADNSSYYLLGYYPAPAPPSDGKFHGVHVAMRRPGLQVHAKAGYFAPGGKPAEGTPRTPLARALGAALPVDGLTLRGTATPLAAVPGGVRTAVTVEVQYPAPSDRDTIDDTLQLGIVAADADGHVKATVDRAFHFTLTRRGADTFRYLIDSAIDVPGEPLTLRIAIASQALGEAGSLHIPLDPVNLSSKTLQVSAVAIGLEARPPEPAVPAGALDGLVPFQPTVARTFSRADELRAFAHVFWGGDLDRAEVTAAIDDADPAARAAVTAAAVGSRHDGVVNLVVPLATAAPGDHVLTITARLADGSAARRRVAFAIQR